MNGNTGYFRLISCWNHVRPSGSFHIGKYSLLYLVYVYNTLKGMTMPTQTVAATETLTAKEIKARAESIMEDLKQYADQAEADRRLCNESV